MTDDTLTFAEAMALDPSEVEVEHSHGAAPDMEWCRLSGVQDGIALSMLRTLRFRRARPKRSRVQKMADAEATDNGGWGRGYYRMGAEAAIRAVCEWLRPMPLSQQRTGQDWAGKIEREFLEPR